jgi:hypothetical protein
LGGLVNQVLGKGGAETLASPGGGDDQATQLLAVVEVAQLAAGDEFISMVDQPELLPAQLSGVKLGGEDEVARMLDDLWR